jgi:phosphoserine aminotransferase
MGTTHYFGAGPAALPPEVCEQAAEAVRALNLAGYDEPGSDLSILCVSHRSPAFSRIHAEAVELCREVLEIPDTHEVLFLQGGSSLQFVMVPLNLAEPGRPACYVDTGVWSRRAIEEAQAYVETRVIASSRDTDYDRIPPLPDEEAYSDASYVHITTNNTIYGTAFPELPHLAGDVPLAFDCSSDVANRPLCADRVGVGYASAQKNLGCSGVTMVFVRKDLLDRTSSAAISKFMRYRTHVDAGCLYHTPNTFAILVLTLVLRWVRDNGGVEAMARRAKAKADKLYAVLDQSSLFRPHAQRDSRSRMNVTWTLAVDDADERKRMTDRLVEQASHTGLEGLRGHWLVGGCRASLYNAVPDAAVDALCSFLTDFERRA